MIKHFLLEEKDATFLRRHISKAVGLFTVLNLNRQHLYRLLRKIVTSNPWSLCQMWYLKGFLPSAKLHPLSRTVFGWANSWTQWPRYFPTWTIPWFYDSLLCCAAISSAWGWAGSGPCRTGRLEPDISALPLRTRTNSICHDLERNPACKSPQDQFQGSREFPKPGSSAPSCSPAAHCQPVWASEGRLVSAPSSSLVTDDAESTRWKIWEPTQSYLIPLTSTVLARGGKFMISRNTLDPALEWVHILPARSFFPLLARSLNCCTSFCFFWKHSPPPALQQAPLVHHLPGSDCSGQILFHHLLPPSFSDIYPGSFPA